MIHSSSGIGVAGQRVGILSLPAIGASVIGGAPADGEAGSDSSSQEGVAPPDWESSWVAAIGIGEGSDLTLTSESVEGIVGSVLLVAAAGESEVAGGFL